nr:MAG TPA: transcriptional repressor [Caudoviricetes sp.]
MESKANAQTKASAKWNKKAGYVAKSYKLKKEVVEKFSEACKNAGVSQAGQLTKMMQEFIEKNK